MELNEQKLRLEGIYKQNDRGDYMQRIKLPGGILSLHQARALAELSQSFGTGVLHLSTRGSIEFHGLQAADLAMVHRGLSAVGLFSRGACGGAVRGISCSSSFGPGFERTQVMLRHFLRYFSGNPHFEGVPKKFKIAFETGYSRSRHLIQDLSFVLLEDRGEESRYDVWFAGGLGREPQAALLFAEGVAEAELLALAESVVEVYKRWGVKGRRLKHMLNEIGESELRSRIAAVRQTKSAHFFSDAFAKNLLPAGQSLRVPLRIFAGELPVENLMLLVEIAAGQGCDWLLVTPDQDIELVAPADGDDARQALAAAGFEIALTGGVRVCPGNQECRMGLCATRELTRRVIDRFGAEFGQRTLAVSGCRNSCAQPQLADFGILASKLKREGDARISLYDLYLNGGQGLGTKVNTELSEEDLFARLESLLAE